MLRVRLRELTQKENPPFVFADAQFSSYAKNYNAFSVQGSTGTGDIKKGIEAAVEELEKVKWTKYKIVVPTLEDKLELEKAFEHIHYSNIDTDNIAVNQLAHEYLTEERTGDPRTINSIIVDEELFNKLNESKND